MQIPGQYFKLYHNCSVPHTSVAPTIIAVIMVWGTDSVVKEQKCTTVTKQTFDIRRSKVNQQVNVQVTHLT